MGPAYVGGSNASLLDVPSGDAGAAGALQNIAFTAGSIIGVALYATVLSAAAAAAVDGWERYLPAFAAGALLMLAVAGSLAVAARSPRPEPGSRPAS
jgi:hypothetical protein